MLMRKSEQYITYINVIVLLLHLLDTYPHTPSGAVLHHDKTFYQSIKKISSHLWPNTIFSLSQCKCSHKWQALSKYNYSHQAYIILYQEPPHIWTVHSLSTHQRSKSPSPSIGAHLMAMPKTKENLSNDMLLQGMR